MTTRRCCSTIRTAFLKMTDQNKELYDRCHAAKYSSKAAKEAIETGLDVNWVSPRFGTSLFRYMCAATHAMPLEMLGKFKLAGVDGTTPLSGS